MKIAMCQMLSEYGRPEENLSRAKEMLRDAARQGAQLALLPECLDLGWANPEAHEMAQPIPGDPFGQALHLGGGIRALRLRGTDRAGWAASSTTRRC